MFYDEWLVCRVTTTCTGANCHAVMQNVTAYVSAARLLEAGRLQSTAKAEVTRIHRHHERILRSFLVTQDIAESRDTIAKLDPIPA